MGSDHPHERLSAYLDGECTAAEAAEIEAHLASCPDCRAEAERCRMLRAHLPEAGAVPVETEERFIKEFRRRVDDAPPQRARHRRRTGFPYMEMALVAALVMIMVVSTFVALGGPLRNMFATAVGTSTMGQNQAALSAGIY